MNDLLAIVQWVLELAPVRGKGHPEEDGWGSLFDDRDSREPIEVNTICLDDWARDVAIGRLDLVKIDIEGGEYGALLGAQQLLKRFRPIVIAELNRVCLSRGRRAPEDVLHLLTGGLPLPVHGRQRYRTPDTLAVAAPSLFATRVSKEYSGKYLNQSVTF